MSRLVIYSFTPTGSSLSQKCYGWNQDTREKTIGYLKQTNKFPSLASVEDTSTLVFSVNDVEVPDEIDVWKAVLFAHRATPDFTISFKVRSEKELVVNGEKEKRALGLHFEARIWLTITYWLPSFLKHIHAAFHFLPQDSQPSRPTPPVDVTARMFLLFQRISAADETEREIRNSPRSGGGKRKCESWKEVVGIAPRERQEDASLLNAME